MYSKNKPTTHEIGNTKSDFAVLHMCQTKKVIDL